MTIHDDVTEIRVPAPRPPAPASNLPVAQPSIRYNAGAVVVPEHVALFHDAPTTLSTAAPVPHVVDVRPPRRPRHAHVEDVVQPSWWARNHEAVLGGLAGGGLVVLVGALICLSVWAWTS